MSEPSRWWRRGTTAGDGGEDVITSAVDRVVQRMYDDLGSQLTMDELARAALYSKFHFSRAFQRVTGVPPGRFLSAMRMLEAQRLLLSTSISVGDIGRMVGYTSIGTFSVKFSDKVGVSPSLYRELGSLDVESGGLVKDNTVLAGHQLRYTLVRRPSLSSRDDGGLHVLAYTVFHGTVPPEPIQNEPIQDDHVTATGSMGPIALTPDRVLRSTGLWLRPKRDPDPPVLLALLQLRQDTRVAHAK